MSSFKKLSAYVDVPCEWVSFSAPRDDKLDQLQAENDRLRKAVTHAAEIITDMCGECPVSRYEWLSSDGCDERCEVSMEGKCWEDYLTGERWG